MDAAFHDLPADCFPMKLELLNRNGTVVWETDVSGPGAIKIPPVAKTHGPVGSRIRFATGEELVEPPPGGWLKPPA